jgi:hypothetical protein
MMGIIVPETCWASNKISNKIASVASSWHFISKYCIYVFRVILEEKTSIISPCAFERYLCDVNSAYLLCARHCTIKY